MKRTLSVLLTLIMVLAIMAPMTVLSYAAEGEVTKSYYLCTKEAYSQNFGKEKSVNTTTKTYDKNGNLTRIVQTFKDSDSECSETYKYKYDSKERVIKVTNAVDYGEGFKSSYTTTYTYNSKGNVTKSKTLYEGEGFESVTTYAYDSNDLLKKTVDSTDYGNGDTSKTTTTYYYDSKGNVIEQTEEDDNNYSIRNIYTYDSKGNEIKSVSESLSPGGEKTSVVITHKYDKNGNLIKKTHSDTDYDGYTSSYTYVYTYNDKGLLTKEKYNSVDGFYDNSYVTTYSYDSKGRLTKESTRTVDDDGTSTEKYTYTYDSNNLLKKSVKIHEFADGFKETRKTVYYYDSKGNEIKNVEYYTDNDREKFNTTVSKAYDKNGNLTKESTKFSDGDTYSYTYNYIKSDKVSYYFDEYGITCSFKDKYTYTGKAITPTVLIRYLDSVCYLKGADYRLIYKNNKNPGKAKIIVDFIDNSEFDDITLTFTIAPKKVTGLKAASVSKSAAKLSWDKAAGAKYYKVEKSADGKKWTAAATVSDTKATIKSLKAGTNYQFRVKALDSSKKVAGKVSTVLKVTTKKK